MDEEFPNLIARAAARLSQAGKPRSTVERAAERVAGVPRDGDTAGPLQPIATERSPQTEGTPTRNKVITVDRGALARTGAAIARGARTRTSEEFQIIKRQVILKALKEPVIEEGERSGRLIMVTSARPGEGKTFTAMNLALSIASEQDFRVLLIDADLHRQSLARLFGVSAEVGWVDVVAGQSADFGDALLRTNIHNLTFLPVGQPVSNVPELLSSNRMSAMLAEMTRRYADRFLIFDAPPCLASSEPSILSGLVGQIVFVVEANRTQRAEIEASLRLISGCANISLLLNKADTHALEEFGSYAEYYHSGKRPE